MVESMNIFASSLLLKQHPVNKLALKIKKQYYWLLKYFITNHYKDYKFAEERLKHYRINFFNSEEELEYTSPIKPIIKTLLTSPYQKFEYYLICDIALILLDPDSIKILADDIIPYLFPKEREVFKRFLNNFLANSTNFVTNPLVKQMLNQYKKNTDFFSQPTITFMVTANMSAGKSTLINALIGRNIAKTSQEVCTGNICYIVNKPFEDERIHLLNNYFTMNANENNLHSITWDSRTCVASYFTTLCSFDKRVCIIDTPGVNSAINPQHGEVTRQSILSEQYDKLIYLLNAGQLGTDEEINHLIWVYKHVPENKIIFVLNKLDNFNVKQDSIENSINGVYEDLKKIGFKNPLLCPISAAYGLLLKRKLNRDILDDDDSDLLELLHKKFSKDKYDLSRYYKETITDNDDDIVTMSKKCGLYGLENILLGGNI